MGGWLGSGRSSRANAFDGERFSRSVAEETVYWVFGKEQGGEEQLRLVGSVNALNPALAENYARSLYGEDANWAEMAVVPRGSVHRFDDVRGA